MSEQSRPWLELRVHGVSGTPVEQLLALPGSPGIQPGRPYPNLELLTATSSRRGLFWRRTDPGLDHDVEGYHWGRYTADTWWKSLWVLLLPFGVINMAQFMLPAPTSLVARVLHALAGSCLRVLGLALSCMSFFAVAFVAMDLVAWDGINHRRGDHYAALGWSAVVVAVVGAALILLLGRQDGPGAAPVPPATPPTEPGAEPPAEVTGLGRAGFYTGSARAPVALGLHGAVITAMLAVLGAWPGAAAGDSTLTSFRSFAGVLAIVLAVVVALSGDPEGGSFVAWPLLTPAVRRMQYVVLRTVSVLGLVVAAGLLGTVAIAVTRTRTRPAPALTPPGIDSVAKWLLFASLTGLLALLLIVTALAAVEPLKEEPEAAHAFRRYAHGMGAAFASTLAVFIDVGFTAAVTGVCALADAILRAATNADPRFVLPYPEILHRALYAWGLTLVELILVVGWLFVGWRQYRRAYRLAAARQYGVDVDPAKPDPLIRRVAFATAEARVKNLVPALAVLLGVVGLVLCLAAADRIFSWPGCRTIVVRLLAGSHERWSWVEGLGALLLFIVIVAAGLQTIRSTLSTNTRRGLNVVWDVILFWPRSVHPFTPAAYSQFVVAELHRHVRRRVREPGARLVLAAHSQGTLISLATVLWLTEEERQRVGLLTFGTQLRQVYGRAFPAYVNREVIAQVVSATSRGASWLNLFRDTDPVAGPLFGWSRHRTDVAVAPHAHRWPDGRDAADTYIGTGRWQQPDEWRLLDPLRPSTGAQPLPDAQLARHSDYWLDVCWSEALAAVLPSHADPPAPS